MARIRGSRAVLTTAVLALGIATGLALGPLSAGASNGDPWILGTSNGASSRTGLSTSDIQALEVADFGATANAIMGWSIDGVGVFGKSNGGSATDYLAWAGDGVLGQGSRNGVSGLRANNGASGAYGQNDGTGYGLAGRATNGTGVFGEGLTSLRGNSLGAADGVDGTANNSCCSAVYGLNGGSGNGVAGRADTGTGVLAASTGGIALKVTGRAQFSRSGLVSIAYPNKSATVSVPGGLTASSLVFALVQDTTGVYVKSAVPNTSNGTVQINLNKAPGTGTNPKTAHVAWFVVN